MNRFVESMFPFPGVDVRPWGTAPARRIVLRAERHEAIPPVLREVPIPPGFPGEPPWAAWELILPAELLRRPAPDPSAPSSGVRALLAERGVERVVRLSDFRELLVPQLSRPDRLRDSHRLACRVRAFEITEPLTWADFAQGVGADPGAACPFAPLTQLAVERLALSGFVPPAVRGPALSRRPGELVAHDRIFEIRPVSDPTADPDPGTGRGEPAGPPLRTSIPERSIRPWEFRRTREEALYDLEQDAPGPLARLGRRVSEVVFARASFRKWRFLLENRSAEEQLWEVPPPQGHLSSPRVREWARRTLERAGYDPRRMLREWEIFWRRKGI